MQRASRNQLANVDNRFQGETTKALCVCSAGLLRSPTIASVLHTEYKCNVRAAGVSQEYALIPVTGALLAWADVIVCADEEHAVWIAQQLKEVPNKAPAVYCLNLPDVYSYNDATLREDIRYQIEELAIYQVLQK